MARGAKNAPKRQEAMRRDALLSAAGSPAQVRCPRPRTERSYVDHQQQRTRQVGSALPTDTAAPCA
jgi:hypothetical protein